LQAWGGTGEYCPFAWTGKALVFTGGKRAKRNNRVLQKHQFLNNKGRKLVWKRYATVILIGLSYSFAVLFESLI
jgi:hypothetical protein